MNDVFALEELQLAGQEALMVVVMEYCDLGGCRGGSVALCVVRVGTQALPEAGSTAAPLLRSPCTWAHAGRLALTLPCAGSLRKALQRRAFRPSAKWPFQTTYVRPA